MSAHPRWTTRVVRPRRALAAAALLAGALAAVSPAPAAAVSSSPASSWQTNGTVDAIAVVGGKVFIGGNFTRVRAPGSSGAGVARNHLAAFDLATGVLKPWNPGANAAVVSFAVKPGGATIYVGGKFTAVGGHPRAHIAAISTDGGKLRKWHANANGMVETVRATRTRLYVGGQFTSVAGRVRHRLAAIGLGSRAPLLSWSPSANATVMTLRLGRTGRAIYAGGTFTSVNGRPRRHLAKLTTGSGALVTGFRTQPLYSVFGLAATSNALFIGGAGDGGHIASVVPGTGATRWKQLTDGDVRTLAVRAGVLYVGGHFNNFCHGGTGSGSPLVCTTPVARRKLLAVSIATGALGTWNPDANSVEGVFAVTAGTAGVQVGGAFTVIHAVAQQGFARFV